MPKKQSQNDQLMEVETFDPEESKEIKQSSIKLTGNMVSPLGPPEGPGGVGSTTIERLLFEVNQKLEQLQSELTNEREHRRELEKQNFKLQATAAQADKAFADLDNERKHRLELERDIASLKADLKHAQTVKDTIESERQQRQDLERKVGLLEYRAEKLSEVSKELEEERTARIQLEKNTATLKVEIQHAKKMEQLLTEERQARANAQMRASTAEAKLAQLEAEKASSKSKKKRSLFGRSS